MRPRRAVWNKRKLGIVKKINYKVADTRLGTEINTLIKYG